MQSENSFQKKEAMRLITIISNFLTFLCYLFLTLILLRNFKCSEEILSDFFLNYRLEEIYLNFETSWFCSQIPIEVDHYIIPLLVAENCLTVQVFDRRLLFSLKNLLFR